MHLPNSTSTTPRQSRRCTRTNEDCAQPEIIQESTGGFVGLILALLLLCNCERQMTRSAHPGPVYGPAADRRYADRCLRTHGVTEWARERGRHVGIFLEVGLTVVAWNRGWNRWALIPCGLAFFVSFYMSLAIILVGGNIDVAMPFFLLLDVACVIALIVMIAKPRKETGEIEPGISGYSASGTDEVRHWA